MVIDELTIHTVLGLFFPHGIVQEDTILNLVLSSTFDDIQKARARVRYLLNTLIKRKYITKKVIYERFSGKENKTNTYTWYSTSYTAASRYEKDKGYIVYVLTNLGFTYAIENLCAPFFAEAKDLVSNSNTEIVSPKLGSCNYARCRQNIILYLSQCGVATPTDYRIMLPTSGYDTALISSKTVVGISEIIAQRLSNISSEQTLSFLENKMLYYTKKEIAIDNLIEANKDDNQGILITAKQLFPIFHTNSFFGTSWRKNVRNQTNANIINFLTNIKYPNLIVEEALMFSSSFKEFSDIVLSSHEKEVTATRTFNRFIKGHNIAAPYKHLYAIPECEATAQQLRYITENTYQLRSEKELAIFGAALSRINCEATFNYMTHLNELTCTPKESELIIPKDMKEYIAFTGTGFRVFGQFYEDSSKVTPVLLGYDMDYVNMSYAYHWLYETDNIGTIVWQGREVRNMAIGCFEWQKPWYEKIFKNIIFIY